MALWEWRRAKKSAAALGSALPAHKAGMPTLVDGTSHVLPGNPLRDTLHKENRGS